MIYIVSAGTSKTEESLKEDPALILNAWVHLKIP